MFPWIYEFHWTTGHILFLGLFFSVLLLVGLTLLKAVWHTSRIMRKGSQEAILWKADFEDLPAEARACRHKLSGEIPDRTCHQGFDCRACDNHQKLLAGPKTHNPLPAGATESTLYGLRISSDRLYHRGHTWVKAQGNGIYTIGLDDFATRLIGEPEAVELPAPGTQLQVNGKAWTMKKRSASIRILSPLDGEVLEHGGANRKWYLKIRVPELQANTDHLLRGAEIKPWLLKEMERLQLALAADGLGGSLADGGELMPDVTRYDPHADWDSVLGEMFLEA